MYAFDKKYDVIIVGAGHAGCEAALAVARCGYQALLLTMNVDTIAHMSCNPAIGGIAKGHLVREIDALGGEMAKNIDATGIQFRMLNQKKGPAVQSPRAQADKWLYSQRMRQVLEQQSNLDIKQALVEEVVVSSGRVIGVRTQIGSAFLSSIVILTTGTFLRGLIHVGLVHYDGGRAGELAAQSLSASLAALGFALGRLKTGTPPRVSRKTIDFTQMIIQPGDEPPVPFSFTTEKILQRQVPCYITTTTETTKACILANLSRSPLYAGIITGTGVRYCPSIEDKMVKFPDKTAHQIFVEPEGIESDEMYINGASTSLPLDVQRDIIHSIKGLEQAEIVRPGYGIEYDFIYTHQIQATLETKHIQGLYCAGQINGTSGYEEAASQGLIAGINAVKALRQQESLVLKRDEAYIGVLIDDLVTKDIREPYRMFTSRAEHRLLLRASNAQMRLGLYGYQAGLLSKTQYDKIQEDQETIDREIKRLQTTYVAGESLALRLKKMPLEAVSDSAAPMASSDISFSVATGLIPEVIAAIKYEGYIKRYEILIQRYHRMENKKIPDWIDYDTIPGLKKESRENLKKFKPASFAQAVRIGGILQADLMILMIWIEKQRREWTQSRN